MGILQFITLLFIILIYLGIVGALLARIMSRGLGSFYKHKGEKVQEVPLGG